MALSNRRVDAPPKGSRAHYEALYGSARANLLLAACITLLNVVLALVGSDSYFLFSASVPYWAAVFGRVEYEVYAMAGYLVIAGVIAVIFTAFYFVFYLMSKKNRRWMDAALVYFALDCVGLIGFIVWVGFDISFIMDILFHIYVMYYLVSGSLAARKAEKMPPDEPVAACEAESPAAEAAAEAPVTESTAEETPAPAAEVVSESEAE